MKHYSYILVFLAGINSCFSQCNQLKTKIMVMGDSWAFFSWTYNSYNENLIRFGFTDVQAKSNINISVNGTRAGNYFDDMNRKQGVKDLLNSEPDLEFCHISLGGNDLLGEWNKSMTDSEVDLILDRVMINLKKVIDTVSSYRPGLKFVVSGYDFPNFVETAAFSSLHPFYEQWSNMGQPNAFEINTVLGKLTQRYVDSSSVWSNVNFVDNTGLMQWYYGQTSILLIPPYITYPPHSVLLPGGNKTYPSPRAAFQVGGADSFHLSDDSYEIFIRRQFEQFYWYALQNPDFRLYAADSTLNGSVSFGTSNPGIIKCGKVASDETSGIITFNTSSLDPSYGVLSASIFLKRNNLSGNNLAGQPLTLEIKGGHFGANEAIESDDVNSPADTSGVACVYGSVSDNDFRMRIDIPDYFLRFINKSGNTQFKIKFNTAEVNNYFEFKNDSYQENQPVLDVKYDYTTLSNASIKHCKVNVYPNPAGDFLFVETVNTNIGFRNQFARLEIISLRGQLLKSIFNYDFQKEIDIKYLKSGIYIIRITNSKETLITKFVKN